MPSSRSAFSLLLRLFHPNGRYVLVAAACLAALSAAGPAEAAVCAWKGGTGAWADASQWTCGAVPGPGDEAVVAGGTIALSGDAAVGTLRLSGGTLEGTGNLTVAGAFEWTGGAIAGGGTIAAKGPTTLDGRVQLRGRTLSLEGPTTWQGTRIYLQTGATLHNTAGQTFTVVQPGEAIVERDGAIAQEPVFINDGTLAQTAPGTALIKATLNNHGRVEVDAGMLGIGVAGAHDGHFDVAAGARLTFIGGRHVLTGATFSGSGTVRLDGDSATLELASSTMLPGPLEMLRGRVEGAGALTLHDAFTWRGGTIAGGGTVSARGTTTLGGLIQLHGRTLSLEGPTTWEGTRINLLDRAVVHVAAGQTFAVTQAAGNSTVATVGTITREPFFVNEGTFVQTAAAAGITEVGVSFENRGTLDIQNGRLRFDRAFDNIGAVRGTGTLDVRAFRPFQTTGTYAPGASPGRLTIMGHFDPTARALIEIEVNGPRPGVDHDQLAITGRARWNGTLRVSVDPALRPQVGNRFTIATCEKRCLNSFSSVEISDLSFGIVYEQSELLLVYHGAPAPEPLTLTYPSGGESWPVGSTQTITWESNGFAGDVGISLFRHDTLVEHLAMRTENDGSYTHTFGVAAGDGYSIRVMSRDDTSLQDRNEVPFSFIEAGPAPSDPFIALTRPAGGEVWPVGSEQAITWESAGVSGDIGISLFRNGKLVTHLVARTENDGSYTHTFGVPAGDGYSIRVMSRDDTSIQDRNEVPFSFALDAARAALPDEEAAALGALAPAASFAEAVPEAFALDANYPNPFNPATLIRFALPEDAPVRLTVYDALGRTVRVLAHGEVRAAGHHEIRFEAGDLPSGLYLYRIEAGAFSATRSMLLLR